MSSDAIIIDDQTTEMYIQDDSNEEKKSNPELSIAAKVDSSSNDDQSQLQRRHFSNKMSSDIFFRNAPTEVNVSSSGNANIDREELLFPSAGHFTRYEAGQDHEKRHYLSPSEDEMQSESNASEDGGKTKPTGAETTEDDQNQTDRRHYHEKTSSDIFFHHLPTEGNVSSGCDSVDREELLTPSAGHYMRYADQREGERRHFHPLSEDNVQAENNATQDVDVDVDEDEEEANLSKSDNLIEVESDTDEQNQTNRQHFHEKTSSDIFFCNLPTEGNVSSGSLSVDKGELLYPSAGHYTRFADGKEGERRHFDSPSEDDIQTESNAANQDDEATSTETAVVQNQTQRHHFHEKNKSDIFFLDSPSEGKKQHFYSPTKDEIQPDSNASEDGDYSSQITKTAENETDDADINPLDRRHYYEKTSSDIFFCHAPAEGIASSGCASVDREELLVPSAGHDTRYAGRKEGERRHF